MGHKLEYSSVGQYINIWDTSKECLVRLLWTDSFFIPVTDTNIDLEIELGLSDDDGIDRCDISYIYSEDYDSKDKTHRHMNSEDFHPKGQNLSKKIW